MSTSLFNPLSANNTKWSNTLKQFVGKFPTNCLSVFDHFVGLALKGLINFINDVNFKVGLSLFRKKCVICFNKSPLKIMKNAFYFTLKALFVLKIFKILSRLFGHVEKTAGLER